MHSPRYQAQSTDERAISDIIGYVLIFSLIVLTIGFVSISGLPTLDSARESEQLQNAERAFDILDSNLAEVYERGAPSRATELSADDATVETRSPVTFNISVTEEGSGNVTYAETEINPIAFSGFGDTEFVYEGGAVFRDQPDNNIMLREPPISVGEDRAFVTVVRTFSEGRQSTGGGTVLVRASSASRSVEVPERSVDNPEYKQMTINISNSPRQDAWVEYLEAELPEDETTCTINGDVLSCDINIGEFGPTYQTFLTVQGIEIDLEI